MSSVLPGKQSEIAEMKRQMNHFQETNTHSLNAIKEVDRMRHEVSALKNTIKSLQAQNGTIQDLKANMDHIYKEASRIEKSASTPSTALRKELNTYDAGIKDLRGRIDYLEQKYDIIARRQETVFKELERLKSVYSQESTG